MSTIPYQISNYTVLPVTIPKTASYPVSSVHTIYLRQHTPKIPTAADERSLFLVNVPIDSTPSHFRAIFNTLVGAGRFESSLFERERHAPQSESQLAPVESRGLEKKRKRDSSSNSVASADVNLPTTWDRPLHRSGSTAVVVLADTKSVEVVLKALKKVHKSQDYPVWGQTTDSQPLTVPRLGSKRYLTHHTLRYPSQVQIEASINAFMSAFNSREEAAAREAKRARNVPDEDGFVTVSRGGRTGPARREEAEEARRKELEKEEEKKRTMGDFYRFQGRERRKAEQGELVKKFEEDRKRVEALKAERRGRFRPE